MLKNYFKTKWQNALFLNEVKYYLNIDNILKITKKKILFLEQKYKNDPYWLKYKLDLLLKWNDLNYVLKKRFLTNLRKIIKKLNLTENQEATNLIYIFEQRFFTLTRSIKVLETPFFDASDFRLDSAYFVYDGIKLFQYNKKKKYVEKKANINLYLKKKSIVFWNIETKKIIKDIPIEQIEKAILNKQFFDIITNDEQYFLSYKDNEVLRISFTRFYKTKILIETLK